MAGTHCSTSGASIPVLCVKIHTKPKLEALTFRPIFRSCTSSSGSCSFSRVQRGSKGGAVSSFACSTSQFRGRVGFHGRQGKVSFLSFGVDGSSVAKVGERDWSQVLSALLPFVVAATAVAALAQPSTFTWWGSLLHDYGFG